MARDLIAELNQGTNQIQQAATQPQGRNLIAELNQSKQPTASTQPQQLDPYQELAKEQGMFQTGAIAAGRGLAKIVRALGAEDIMGTGFPGVETPEERQAFQALERERPVATAVGEAVGEALPFAAVPVGAVPGTIGRVAAATGLGALEGGLIKRGEGATETEQLAGAGIGGAIAGGMEAILPVIGRIGGKIIRRVTGKTPKGSVVDAAGRPSQELAEALQKSGMSFDDLQQGTIEFMQKQQAGAVPEQAARAARFKEVGIPATRGDITQEFGQQAVESRLFEAAADPLGDPLRSLRLQQSEGIKQNLESLVERSGVPENVGDAIKDALSGKKAMLKAQKNALYRKAAAAADDAGVLPFPTENIEAAIPDQRKIDRIARIKGSQVNGVTDLLSEFGILPPKEGIEPIQLSIQNFDDFRMALGQLERADQTGATSVIVGPIREALDLEAENIDTIFKKAGVKNEVLEPLKDARDTVRQLKTEFDPKGTVGRLIEPKGQAGDQVIEASKVFNDIVGTNQPIEKLEKTLTALKQAGPKGIKAIGDLQAATVRDVIDQAFKAETRRVQGVKTFGAVPFKRRLAQIGEDKLNLIFSTNKPLLKELKKVAAVADDLIPPSGAIPKGSASVILDSLNKAGIMTILGKVPGGGLFAEGINRLAEGQANRSALKQAMNASPDIRRTISLIESEMPSMASALGIATVIGDENK